LFDNNVILSYLSFLRLLVRWTARHVAASMCLLPLSRRRELNCYDDDDDDNDDGGER